MSNHCITICMEEKIEPDRPFGPGTGLVSGPVLLVKPVSLKTAIKPD